MLLYSNLLQYVCFNISEQLNIDEVWQKLLHFIYNFNHIVMLSYYTLYNNLSASHFSTIFVLIKFTLLYWIHINCCFSIVVLLKWIYVVNWKWVCIWQNILVAILRYIIVYRITLPSLEAKIIITQQTKSYHWSTYIWLVRTIDDLNLKLMKIVCRSN